METDKPELVKLHSPYSNYQPNMQLLIEDSLPNTLIEAYFAAASKHQSNVIANPTTAQYQDRVSIANNEGIPATERISTHCYMIKNKYGGPPT